MPRITVLVTTYNLETYLEDFLMDLENQEFQDFEVLIVDDSSTDATRSILQNYAQKNPERCRVIFLKQNMGSPSRTRNVALDACASLCEYVIFLDGDDRMEPAFLGELLSLAESSDADISVCAYDRFENGTCRILGTEMRGFPKMVHKDAFGELPAFINSALWNKLIRSDLLKHTRIPDLSVGEDLCFAVSLYMKSVRVAFTDRILVHYRVRGGSIISNISEDAIHCFASALSERANNAEKSVERELYALIALIHIGLSMAIRAEDNPAISTKRYLRWTRRYLADCHHVFAPNKSLSFCRLRRYGIRGYAVWVSKILYRLRLFRFLLIAYKLATRIAHREFKF